MRQPKGVYRPSGTNGQVYILLLGPTDRTPRPYLKDTSDTRKTLHVVHGCVLEGKSHLLVLRPTSWGVNGLLFPNETLLRTTV